MVVYKWLQGVPSKLENGYTAKTDGNVYYLSLSLLKDAKRKYNGTPKKTLSKTWFTCLFT
jgi:hypothetical protein